MQSEEERIVDVLNRILLCLIEGKREDAAELLGLAESEFSEREYCHEFLSNLREFISQYFGGAVFLNAIANGNLEVNPPDDPFRQNYVITQYKQLHSNLLHLTWQTQQIARGDLKQKVSFLGEFSIGFNKMIEALREKKLMEDKINLQNEQLLKLNAEKDKFFSIIAHDLRSPFTGFLGLTQLMAEDLKAMSLDDIQGIAVNMRDSATNIYRLLENLLEWSRMEQGLIPFHPVEIELLGLVHESTLMILEAARVKGIEIQYSIAEELQVVTDRNILKTILRNLLSNAVKFTPRGGQILITAKAAAGNSVEVCVRDSGIGMNAELAGKLFRIDASTGREGTEGESSTGLGLILCKEFVEKHGGSIRAESEEGKGSSFYFTIGNQTP